MWIEVLVLVIDQHIYANKDNVNISQLVEIISKVTPNYIETLEARYNMLKIIDYLEPIGRRSLSNKLNISERNARTEANVLKEQGLIDISAEGMKITSNGKDTIEKLDLLFHELKGFKALEERVKRLIGIKEVFIVSGSVDDREIIYKDVGKIAANYVKSIIKNGNVLGLTGGTTVFHVIEEYKKEKEKLSRAMVVPARGGLGKKVEYQANTLVQKLAGKIGCGYKTLYTPDSLLQSTIKSLRNEPSIKEIMELIDNIDILLFGVGRADTMAKRRGLREDEIENLIEKNAVSEAFGYYFNKSGDIVHEVSTIGINLRKFKTIKNAIAVAAGKEKTEAIISICNSNKNLVLITDEGTANNIIFKYKKEF
jgi:central glycolytic genes regulator